VPPVPTNTPTAASSSSVRCNHAKQQAYRNEFLRRIGTIQSDARSDIRICNHHMIDTVTKTFTYQTTKGETKSSTVSFNVPCAYMEKSNLNQHSTNRQRDNKGSSYRRFESNYVQETIECANNTPNGHWGYAFFLAIQRSEEAADDPNQNNIDLVRHDSLTRTNRKKPMYGIIHAEKIPAPVRKRTTIQLHNLSSYVLRISTGFRSMESMVSFICIVCNGNINLMSTTSSSLTWLEEWMFYFERVYGRSVTRMVDCEVKYCISTKILRKIFNNKLAIVLAARRRWPMFVSFHEDAELRADKWNATYTDRRIIMWDNTDVTLSTPSHPNLQRNTYSDYYAGNVGKGSVFIQLCGWLGTHELWEGAVTDSDYFARSGILQLQEQYLELYDPDCGDKKWVNILDRGYKVVGECFINGGQYVLQPSFCHASNPKFTANETQLTAAVASDRGANERAVRMAKLSKYISEGYKQTVSVDQLCDVWLAWSFQCNFVYKAVL
jgi:DDE superfamily endonuclease